MGLSCVDLSFRSFPTPINSIIHFPSECSVWWHSFDRTVILHLIYSHFKGGRDAMTSAALPSSTASPGEPTLTAGHIFLLIGGGLIVLVATSYATWRISKSRCFDGQSIGSGIDIPPEARPPTPAPSQRETELGTIHHRDRNRDSG